MAHRLAMPERHRSACPHSRSANSMVRLVPLSAHKLGSHVIGAALDEPKLSPKDRRSVHGLRWCWPGTDKAQRRPAARQAAPRAPRHLPERDNGCETINKV